MPFGCFVAVCRAGRLTGAAKALGVGIQTVGRRIDALEVAIGAKLFVRHSVGWKPKPDADALLKDAESVEKAVARFHARAGGGAGTISGVVRLAAPETITTHLQIIAGIAPVGIARGEADLALRLVPPKHGASTVRKIGTMSHGLYVGPGPMPNLASVRLVGWTHDHHLPVSRWLHSLTGRSPDIRLNHLDAQRAAIATGLGIGILRCFLGSGLSRLSCPLFMEEPLWLVGHAVAEMSQRSRLVYDVIATIIATNHASLAGLAS
jgi:DNA-binding transcriptional LysR family regulator